MERLLHIEVAGKFNGKDAKIAIELDAESAFEIEDVSADQQSSASAEATTAPQQSQPLPGPTPEKPPSGDATPRFDPEEMPPLSNGSNQFIVANALHEWGKDHEEEKATIDDVWEWVQEHHDVDETWGRQKVGSNMYKLNDKKLTESEQVTERGKKAYWLNDLGKATVEYNKET